MDYLSNMVDRPYLQLLQEIYEKGVEKTDRTGVGTKSIFGAKLEFNLNLGFPILTTKKIHFKSVVHELLWFLSGNSNIKQLTDNGVTIWNEWADQDGELGPVYGIQWRKWKTFNEVEDRYWSHQRPTGRSLVLNGVGAYGSPNEADPYFPMLYEAWESMLLHCYAVNELNDYGNFVNCDWLTFSNFMEDAVKLPGWNLKRAFPGDYVLSKDRNATNRFSNKTCAWVSKEEHELNISLSKVPTSKIRVKIHDQIRTAISEIKFNPDSRRIIVSSWNVNDLDRMKLQPCHVMFQFYVVNNKLSCSMYQRSVDTFLGLPFNISSYALLTHMIAHVCGLGVDKFVWFGGDVHIYKNHFTQVEEQLCRKPLGSPTLKLDPLVKDIDEFRAEHIVLENYKHHDAIKAPIAV